MKIKRMFMIILALSLVSPIISIALAVNPPSGTWQYPLFMGTDGDHDQLWTDKQVIWIIPIKDVPIYKEDIAYDGQDIVKTSLQFWYKYEVLNWDVVLDENGNPILDEDGNPIYGWVGSGEIDWAQILFEPKVSITDSQVKIWWNQEDLESLKYDGEDPRYDIQNGRVTGWFEDGLTFYAQGPGWTGAFRPK